MLNLPKYFGVKQLELKITFKTKAQQKLFQKTKHFLNYSLDDNQTYLNIFRSEAQVLIQKETLQKLDSHYFKAIFFGYCEESKAYPLINTFNQKIMISTNVVFNENIEQNIDIQKDKEE